MTTPATQSPLGGGKRIYMFLVYICLSLSVTPTLNFQTYSSTAIPFPSSQALHLESEKTSFHLP